jgi:hypothetical protein
MVKRSRLKKKSTKRQDRMKKVEHFLHDHFWVATGGQALGTIGVGVAVGQPILLASGLILGVISGLLTFGDAVLYLSKKLGISKEDAKKYLKIAEKNVKKKK